MLCLNQEQRTLISRALTRQLCVLSAPRTEIRLDYQRGPQERITLSNITVILVINFFCAIFWKGQREGQQFSRPCANAGEGRTAKRGEWRLDYVGS